ncbi:MAG TPA: CDGSH iron-sulfur domain-containing protein [Steroidobacteraceae bacterium]|nr:CDGSH iron-sulfur domain-containing protein [Steroidobacteraceae bacterium]
MADPVIARPKPCLVKLERGRTYFWCACGRSALQPFCDGSHRGTGLGPRKLVAGRSEEVLLCGCKRSCGAPFCDGAHTNLPGGSPLDDPESPANRLIPVVAAQDGPRRWLNDGCYVVSPALAPKDSRERLRYCYLVTPELGARFQTQVLLEVRDGASPVLSWGVRDAILLVAAGSGRAIISGREFEVKPHDGLYVRPGEGLQLLPAGRETLSVFALVSPQGELEWPAAMPHNFDASFPERVASVAPGQRTAMGPRYFQLLVDKRLGSRTITQFIGHIPRSKAAPHRHLYEEALIVLAGKGCIWTEDRKARVEAGEVVFLPRRQLHSLEATSAEGMLVAGVICPGDNPSIAYYD